MSLVVLLGGARAGKSKLALELAARWNGPVTYVATAEARDHEMSARIARHRADRPDAWMTIEEPLALSAALDAIGDDSAVIVDCLTLWVSNLVERGDSDAGVVEEAETVARRAASRTGPVLAVTNEVGLGIVPANELARAYRDLLGEVNAVFVAHAEHAALVVAGRLLPLSDASTW